MGGCELRIEVFVKNFFLGGGVGLGSCWGGVGGGGGGGRVGLVGGSGWM